MEDSKRKLFEPKVRIAEDGKSIYFSGLTLAQADELINFATKVMCIVDRMNINKNITNITSEPWTHKDESSKKISIDSKYFGTPICEPKYCDDMNCHLHKVNVLHTHNEYDITLGEHKKYELKNNITFNANFTPIDKELLNYVKDSSNFEKEYTLSNLKLRNQDNEYFKGEVDDVKACSFVGTAQSISITPDKPSLWHRLKRVLMIIASIRLRYDYENYRINHSSIGLTWNKDPLCDKD